MFDHSDATKCLIISDLQRSSIKLNYRRQVKGTDTNISNDYFSKIRYNCS